MFNTSQDVSAVTETPSDTTEAAASDTRVLLELIEKQIIDILLVIHCQIGMKHVDKSQ